MACFKEILRNIFANFVSVKITDVHYSRPSMRFLKLLVLPLVLAAVINLNGSAQTYKDKHEQLLAAARLGVDKVKVLDYLNGVLESMEYNDPVFGNLCAESIVMIGDLLNEAQSHYGKRYRYASKGPDTFDCSGFTGYVYGQFGYNIGTSSKGQYLEGVAVENGDLRPGDLVFFTSPRSRGAVGHVGIVVTADNSAKTFTFIHASVKKGIRMESSTTPYYVKRYIGARRIITE